ncbi:MAG: FGGY-family carbohydrate kinase, partial [Sphaerochaetaceae bacterium]|nr:FGGY-family carbohydrate kinase [Sphaerochaetaceae bacterium]
KEIRLIGGGAKSKVWRSMCADIFNVKIVIPEVTEGAAFGAALQALWALSTINGGGRTIQDIADEHVILDSDHIYYPDEKRVESYETAYKRYLNYMKEVEHMFK